MRINPQEFLHLNSFYERNTSAERRRIVYALYEGRCQGCTGQPLYPIEETHVAHIIPRSLPQEFEQLFPGLDIDNLLNLHLLCRHCNLRTGNDYVSSPMLLARQFNSSARLIRARYHQVAVANGPFDGILWDRLGHRFDVDLSALFDQCERVTEGTRLRLEVVRAQVIAAAPASCVSDIDPQIQRTLMDSFQAAGYPYLEFAIDQEGYTHHFAYALTGNTAEETLLQSLKSRNWSLHQDNWQKWPTPRESWLYCPPGLEFPRSVSIWHLPDSQLLLHLLDAICAWSCRLLTTGFRCGHRNALIAVPNSSASFRVHPQWNRMFRSVRTIIDTVHDLIDPVFSSRLLKLNRLKLSVPRSATLYSADHPLHDLEFMDSRLVAQDSPLAKRLLTQLGDTRIYVRGELLKLNRAANAWRQILLDASEEIQFG